jgi:hypothetical protein
MKMPGSSSGDADKSKQSTAEKKRTTAAKNSKNRIAKPRRYRPPDNRREWYERAESQLAITPKASGKARGGS